MRARRLVVHDVAPRRVRSVVEAFKKDIDRTLLRLNLRRTVAERLANLVAMQRLAEEARRAGKPSLTLWQSHQGVVG